MHNTITHHKKAQELLISAINSLDEPTRTEFYLRRKIQAMEKQLEYEIVQGERIRQAHRINQSYKELDTLLQLKHKSLFDNLNFCCF